MRIESKVKGYVGYVELPDYLNILQVRAFEDAYFGDLSKLEQDDNKRVFFSVSDERLLPVIIDIVKEWHIEGLPDPITVENFPASPAPKFHEFISLVGNGLYKLWIGEVDDPNA